MSAVNILKVVLCVFLAWAGTEIIHYFVPFEYRVFALIAVYLLIFLLVFLLIRPARPYVLSRWLSLWLTLLAIVIIVAEDIIIKGIPISQLVRGVTTIVGLTLLGPFAAGWAYNLFRKK